MDESADASTVYLLSDQERNLVRGGPALVDADGTRHDVPPRVFEILRDIEAALRSGRAVKLIRLHTELTIQEAAEAVDMNVEDLRVYIGRGEVPYRSVNDIAWVKLSDVVEFDRRLRAQTAAAMQQLRNEEPWDDEADPSGSTD